LLDNTIACRAETSGRLNGRTCQDATIQQRGKIMGGLEILGFLAIAIGVIGIIVLLKSRKKSDN
jgi:hypothetical protein